MGIRRKGREIALQALYSQDFESKATLENLKNIAKNDDIDLKGKIYKFARVLVKNVLLNLDEIDRVIITKTKNWSFERIALVDKALLRIGICELLYTDVPKAVVINEAIEISKVFCSEKSGNYINGILNGVEKKDIL